MLRVGVLGIVPLALLALWIFALIDVITSDESEVRNLPKFAWILLVLLIPSIGAIVWFIAGRPVAKGFQLGGTVPYRGTGGHAGRPATGVVDANAERARSEELDRRLAEWEAQQAQAKPEDLAAWEEDLRPRDGAVAQGEDPGLQAEDPVARGESPVPKGDEAGEGPKN